MASKKSIKNVGRSIEKSKKTISEENIKPIKFPKILVPVEERIRLPNLSLEQIKNIEKFNVPKADSYFRTEYLTKEPRLVQALDNIQAYLSQRKKLLTY
ncbi:Hypothetical protein SRAE_2000342800 [Strongyloides ratti]|uniref:Uncharacterized protein n=1 Tax=Strongyloides ratti TaxID=34506 RepID=A0A090LKU1_STRRB|nr:Hypothetical protein SRAE_2000342800 [Strongyloides ratti]CEF68773.1 Hypothetical protein SRAE_2000342800 [Strongyloides ratti]